MTAAKAEPEPVRHTIAIYGGPAVLLFERLEGFPAGSTQLSPEHDERLDGLAKLLSNYPEWRIAIDGHADTSEGKHAQSISEKRAATVRDALTRRGIAARRLAVKGFGATRPIDASETEFERSHNRRVEFRLVARDAGTD